MKKLISAFAISSFLALTGCGEKTETPAPEAASADGRYTPGPAIWKVTDEDTTLYLFGTVHLLKAGTDWRSDAFEAAWSEAGTLYLETDMSMEAQLETQQLMNRMGMNETGTKLSGFFSAEELEIVKEGAREAKLPFAMLEPMRPWLAMLIISVQQYITEGADPTAGVDFVLGQEAVNLGKERRFFETGGEQISFFADFDDEAAADMLIEGLVYAKENPDLFDRMTTDWLAGQPEKLAEMINESMTTDTALVEVLLYQRNRNWVEELARVMEDETGVFLVAVGAGHLAGENSVQDYMAEKGYVAERQ